MINPNWLKTFCTLADVGHFTQTAELLFMTQSGVSQHIKKLERQLGTSLLSREGKSFSLTDAGQKLHQQGKTLLHDLAELAVSIKHDDPHCGTIKIATPGSVGLKLYPFLLDKQQQYPNLVIDYRFAPNNEIESKLAERAIEIGIVTELTTLNNVVCQKIADEPLVLITSSNIKSLSWPTLIKLGFISHPDAAHHTQQLLSKNFNEYEHVSQFEVKGFSNQISLILEPISRGIGFTVLPLHAANAFTRPSKVHVHRLPNAVNETLYLCSNRHMFKTQRHTFIHSTIIDFLQKN